MKRRSREDAYLADYVDAYLDEAAAMTMTQLRARQPAPHASLGLGAAAIAYAFLRAFEAGRGAEHLAVARRWSAATWRARTRPDAIRGSSESGTALDPAAASVAYGRAGIAFVEAAVGAGAPAVAARHGRGIDELVALSRLGAAATADFMQGVAGRLAAITAVHERAVDPRLARVGDRLAGWLIAAPPPSYGPWFAYGAMGGVHAVLRWSLRTGYDLPGPWLDRLDELARMPMPDRGHPLDRSWCNGSAGVAITLAAAHVRTGRASLAAAAKVAADHAGAEAPGAGGLCCGLVGRAYALLAVDRIAPAPRWRARARGLAIAALDAPPPRFPNGLLHGHPALVCLALDLLEPGRAARFPLVDG